MGVGIYQSWANPMLNDGGKEQGTALFPTSNCRLLWQVWFPDKDARPMRSGAAGIRDQLISHGLSHFILLRFATRRSPKKTLVVLTKGSFSMYLIFLVMSPCSCPMCAMPLCMRGPSQSPSWGKETTCFASPSLRARVMC